MFKNWEQLEESIKDCSKCKKHHTKQCPNSSKCWDTLEKPYFEEKVGG